MMVVTLKLTPQAPVGLTSVVSSRRFAEALPPYGFLCVL
jgi:hypothetical protein